MDLVERVYHRVWRSGLPNHFEPIPFAVSLEFVLAEEARLGFQLPELMRRLYSEVGNGGFGPCFGFIGLTGGAWFDEDDRFLVENYWFSRNPSPYNPHWILPEGLLTVTHCGCGIEAYLDCTQQNAPVFFLDTTGQDTHGWTWERALILSKPSLSTWLEEWLAE